MNKEIDNTDTWASGETGGVPFTSLDSGTES